MKKNLILLMSNLPWDWSTDYPNQTAFALQKKHVVICYMLADALSLKEHFKKRRWPKLWQKHSENLFLYTPICFLPFRRSHFITKINDQLNVSIVKSIAGAMCLIKKLDKKILWTFDPSYYDFYHKFDKDFFLIYDCVDYFVGTAPDLERKRFITSQEEKLLRSADVVTTISHTLKKIHQKIRKNIHVVPQGFRVDQFESANLNYVFQLPKTKPLIGFVGALQDRLDYDLLLNLIKKTRKYTYVFAGPIQENFNKDNFRVKSQIQELFSYSNVYYLGIVSKDKIPALINKFDICMIPYDEKLEFNKNSYPMKLFEYFYFGKPVITTGIKEMSYFRKYLKVCSSVGEWENAIKFFLSDPLGLRKSLEEKDLAIGNSWEEKVKVVESFIGKLK